MLHALIVTTECVCVDTGVKFVMLWCWIRYEVGLVLRTNSDRELSTNGVGGVTNG